MQKKILRFGWLRLPTVRWFFTLVAAIIVSGSVAGRAQTATAPPEVTITEAFTVMVWNRPLAVLRATIGDVTPQQRAARIRERFEQLPPEALDGPVLADRAELGGLEGLLITVNGHPILGILPQDLNPESAETLEEVGREVERNLQEILRARREQQQTRLMLERAGLAVGTAVLAMLFIVLVLRFRRLALRRQSKWMKRPHTIHGFDFGASLARIVMTIINLVTIVAVLTAVQSWLAFALTQFPYTRPWGEGLRSYLVGLVTDLALGALRAVPGLFTAVVILVVARFFSATAKTFFQRVERGEFETPWLEADTARATRRLATALIWIFAITAAYPYLPGAETQAFKGVSVFVGIMVSLGGVGFVNQVMSGLVVVYARTFRIGDYVRVADKEGIVTEIGTLSTKITTRTREEITVPNAVLVGSTVTNYTRLAGAQGSVLQTTVTIGYDTPWRQVHGLLELAAERTPGVRREPKPTVLQRSLSDFYVEYQLLVHIEKVEARILVLSDLHANIQDAFNEYGVQIMSPHFRGQPGEKVFVPKQRWVAPPVDEASQGEATSKEGDS